MLAQPVESPLDTVEIPNRSVFRAAEVCELASIQPYVLRGWEAEFPDLGISKSAGAPRIYRRADVERVLRLKHLILVDGLTLAGARKVMTEEGTSAPAAEDVEDSEVAAMMDEAVLAELREVKDGLEWILNVLGGSHTANGDFALRPPRVKAAKPRKDVGRNFSSGSKKAAAKKAKPVKGKKKGKK
ncbi:MAG: MerR family transcriptional regulator [Acidobacteria bacterium]|nr:MAG: MerR family transcriptional regulator [Acidobacteriota bacterium]